MSGTYALSSFERFVKSCAVLTRESPGLILETADGVFPWFRGAFPLEEDIAFFLDGCLAMAIVKSNGDPADVWRCFQEIESTFSAQREAYISGSQSRQGLAKGRRNRWGDTEQRIAAVRESFKTQLEKCPDRSHNLLVRYAARESGVSESTIRRHLLSGDLDYPGHV